MTLQSLIVTSRKSVLHLSRWILVGTIVIMGGALLLTVWITYTGVGDASEALVRGKVAELQADLRGEFRELQQPITDQDLQAILQTYSDTGLHFVALVGRDGLLAKAGKTNLQPQQLHTTIHSLRRRKVLQHDGLVRVLLRSPPVRATRRRGNSHWQRTPPVYIEFEPKEAIALRASSTRSLATGAGAAILLMFIAVVFVRWYTRQDAQRKQEEEDRRLKSLGQMSAILAHEIRNPLASLKGNAQILETMIVRELDAEGKPAKKANRVVGEAIRLETLVNDLLDFARSGTVVRQNSDPAEILQECASAISPETINVDVSSAPPQWSIDTARIRQVLNNLLQNATQESDTVNASVRCVSGNLVFVIRDYGAGIDVEHAEQLFEPFHTKKSQGTGLGLAVAKRLVELHGGTITATNAVGGGAEFTVNIPS